MLINRKAIHDVLVNVEIEARSSRFSEEFDNLLEKVDYVEFSTGLLSKYDTDYISKESSKLIDEGLVDYNTEDLIEPNEDMVEDFFDGIEKKKYHLLANSEVLNDTKTEYEVFGVSCEETGKYYLITKNSEFEQKSPNQVFNSCGLIVSNAHFLKLLNLNVEIEGYDYFGTFINDSWIFYMSNSLRSCVTLTNFDMITRLFSRNSGLLESSVMSKKSALIVGCGSVGSLIALELAKAGVGLFILVDSDTLEMHNVCRHQLGFRNLGRFKVDAVEDAIYNINPYAKVISYRGLIQDLPSEYVLELKEGIVIGTGDNRESSAFSNELAKALDLPFVSTGCWQRAHAGECFYWYPDSGLPVYREAFLNLITEERPKSHNNYFADDSDEISLNFEPGISTDIGFVTLIAVKIIYDLLNRNTENYTKRVLSYLTQYTLVCNTNEAVIGGENAECFPHPLFISNTISLGNKKRLDV